MKKIFNFKSAGQRMQKGVTVIELLLYMGILVVFLTLLTSVFVSALDVQSESQSASGIEQDGNYILTRLTYDIHRAQAISVPATNSATLDNFIINIGGEDYAYGVDENNNLILTNNSGVENLNNYNSGVSAFSVTRFGNLGGVENTLKINFTLTSRINRVSGYETKNFETNLSLRRQ